MPKTTAKHKMLWQLLWAALAAVFVLAACCWVGYDLTESLGDLAQYTLLNDEYSAYEDLTPEGLTQLMPVQKGVPVYGVRLRIDTHDQAYAAGEIQAELFAPDGRSIGAAARDYLDIIGDNFVTFAFEEAYTPAQDETLTLRITVTQPWPGTVSLWRSETPVEGMPLYIGGEQPAQGTLALQQVTAYAGHWPMKKALQLAVPLAAAAFLAVLLAQRKAHPALLTAAVGLCLGAAFLQMTPSLVAPDEYTHLEVSYELASRWSGQPVQDRDGKLLLRECDAPYFETKTGKIGVLAYKQADTALREQPGSANRVTTTGKPNAGQVGNGSYGVQALGIWLARSLGKNFYTMLYFGRAANLLLYLVLAALAVWLAPAAVQGLFAAVTLLPMPLQLAASLSPDALVLGLVFSFTALCLRLRSRPAAKWELVLLVLLGAAAAPGKAVYLPVILLCFAVPPQNLLADKPGCAPRLLPRGCLVQLGVMGLAVLLWAKENLQAVLGAAGGGGAGSLAGAVLLGAAAMLAAGLVLVLYRRARNAGHERRFWLAAALLLAAAVPAGILGMAHVGSELTPEQLVMQQANGESPFTYTMNYAAGHLAQTAKLLLRSIPAQGELWLQGILGTTLGEPIVYRIDVSWLLGVGLILALLLAALPVKDRQAPLGRRTAWGTAGIAAAVCAVVVVVALSWTPIDYTVLFGLQGRYLLPVLPAALVTLKSSRTVQLQRDMSQPACTAVSLITVITILQGFALYASWQDVI